MFPSQRRNRLRFLPCPPSAWGLSVLAEPASQSRGSQSQAGAARGAGSVVKTGFRTATVEWVLQGIAEGDCHSSDVIDG